MEQLEHRSQGQRLCYQERQDVRGVLGVARVNVVERMTFGRVRVRIVLYMLSMLLIIYKVAGCCQ